MSAPYISLGLYKPARWHAARIGRELCFLTHQHGLKPHFDPNHGPLVLKGRAWSSDFLHAEVRRRTFATKTAEDWHYDGDTTPNSNPDCGIVLWASNHPTEIKLGTFTEAALGGWRVWQPEPNEVVIFANRRCLHRRPPGVPRMRWVFRQRVALDSYWKERLGCA